MDIYDKNCLPKRLIEFAPYPPAAQRKAWEALPENVQNRTAALAEQALAEELPLLPATDWLDFSRKGSREVFENKYFARRRRLCALTLGECVSYEGRYIDAIVDTIFAICEESGWQLPAHNSYERNQPGLPLPDSDRPLLDLFSCETGAVLSCCLYLLREELAAVTPMIGERIARELRRRILTPYCLQWFWWMGGHGERTLNWTAWCTQNVLLAAFFVPLQEEERHEIVLKAMESLNAFLADYGEDGCCDEGAQYYRHAGLCLFNAAFLLDEVTGGAFKNIWRLPKIKNMANYILNVHINDKYYVNFADCSPVAGRCGAREYLFAKACGEEPLMHFACEDWAKEPDKALSQENNLYYRLQSLFTEKELQIGRKTLPVPHAEIFYPSTGLFIAHDSRFTLAVKAGNNADNHNHNDVGGFTLYAGGKPLLIDIGVETYTAKTFSANRYAIWTMQSSWHNLPDFDGIMQQAGKEYAAADVKVNFSEKQSEIAMQLAKAWPAEAGLQNYCRRAVLQKEKGVRIEDVCGGSYTHAVLHLIFCEKPLLKNNVAEVPHRAKISIKNGGVMHLEEIPITDQRLQQAWESSIYRLTIPFKNTVSLWIE